MLRAFPVSHTRAASRWLRNQPSGVIPSKTVADAKVAIQEMAEFSHKWHNGTSSKSRSTETSDGIAAIQAQLNNLEREIKKKTLEKAYYTYFDAPYQPGGQYRAAVPGFYQRNNGNSSYPDRRPSMEESLSKFMAESSKRHEENSNIIKEIQASTDAEIRNQGALIKTLEIQIGQMSKVLQERGFGSLPSFTETNPRDQVKLISTSKPNFSKICHVEYCPYAISGFTIIDDDDETKGVVLGMPFCKKYSSCQMIMKKFIHGDECKQIKDE
nr:hypothetical protein [Tanacetum cinerariifolium]